MRQRWAWVGVLLVGVALLWAFTGAAGTASSLFTPRYKAGETILFKVETETTCWWCSCSCGTPACAETQVLSWRVVDSSGKTLYSVVHDAPVAATGWQGSWTQVDSAGAAAAAGYYTLYVDTSVGTLSLCVRIYDPCNSCGQFPCCGCQENSTITNCCCRTSLVLVPAETGCFAPFFFFGWPCHGGCSGGTPCGCSGWTAPCTHCP